MTKEQLNNKTKIIEWFNIVCEGIRKEYEQGASCRKLTIDVASLEKWIIDIISKNPTTKLREYIDEKLKSIEKYHDTSGWCYTEIDRMESEEAYYKGVFETLKIIKDLLK